MLSKAEIEERLKAIALVLSFEGTHESEMQKAELEALETAQQLYEKLDEARRLLESAVKLNEFENRWPVFCQTVRIFLEKNNKRRGGGFDAG